MNRKQTQKELMIRFAKPNDAAEIVRLIKELATYEKDPDAAVAKPEDLAAQMKSEKPPFECILAEVNNKVVGFALFFQNYSTWQGLPGLFLEDLYVQPEHRGSGIGKRLLHELAEICRIRNYGRMEWEVLTWNKLAIDFYNSLGAELIDEKYKCRLSGNYLQKL